MKIFKWILFSIIALILIALIIFFPTIKRLNHTIHLFDEDRITENFQNMYVDYNASTIEAPSESFQFPVGQKILLPESFDYKGDLYDTKQYLDSSFTSGLVVISNDTLVFEEYYKGITESTQWISWSVAKSFVSVLMGIAVEEGHIKSIEQKVEAYCPELIGTGYEGVRIKDVLQMSTGVAFNEDYGDFNSDINRWGRGFALGQSQDAFAASLVNEVEPGTVNHYVSINTHVLGMIIVKATGKSLSEYLQEKLWEPMGMEYNAYWMLDGKNMEVALGGLNVTMRDYAKMGQLFLNEGNWKGEQLISKEWVKASLTPDAPHLMPKDVAHESLDGVGYGFQWWIPFGNEGEFMALGVYNQHIYVNPTKRVVIVKLSANHRFNEKGNPYASWKGTLEMFREITNTINE